MALLTHSRLKTARQCLRLHRYKYLDLYRPAEDAAALAFGSLLHVGLEAWWLAAKSGVPRELWLGVAVHAVKSVADVDPYDMARAVVLLAGYHVRWSEDAALYEVLGVEEQFEFPLVNPETGGQSPLWRVAGKLDVRVRRLSDGAHGIIEHKTSSMDVGPGSSYVAQLRLDGQVSTYFDGATSLSGEPTAFCLYDVLGKPAQKPLKATPLESRKFKANGELYAAQRLEDETPADYQARVAEAVSENPDKYFQRTEVVRLESELDEARSEIWQQAAQLRENANANRHPRNPDSCNAYGRLCPFFAVCCGEASLENEALFTRLESPHPELAGHPTNSVERGDVNATSQAAPANPAT